MQNDRMGEFGNRNRNRKTKTKCMNLKILKEVFSEIWANVKGLVWFVLIVCVILILWSLLRDSWRENERLSENQSALMTKAQTYKTESERNAMSVKTLTLRLDELKENESQLTEKCKELEIQLKRVKSINQTGTESKYTIKGETHDSIIYVPVSGKADTLICSDYKDDYISFSYCVDSARIYTADIVTRDTITAIAHRVPKKFLFIRYGTKEIKMEVISSNPHTILTTATRVEVVK